MIPEVEKNVPIPVKVNPPEPLYPFDKMFPDDSFFVACDFKQPTLNKIYTAMSKANKIGKAEGKRFTSRKVEGGIRIWRVS